MRKVLFAVVLLSFIVGLGDTLDACGSKFLVGASSDPRIARSLANVEPTTILVYWRQDENTPDEDLWSPAAEKLLEDVGHTVEVTLNYDAFVTAAANGDYEVVLMHPIEEARVVQDEATRLLPDSALLPISHNSSRRELREAKKEFGNVMKTPCTIPEFLRSIEKSRESVEG